MENSALPENNELINKIGQILGDRINQNEALQKIRELVGQNNSSADGPSTAAAAQVVEPEPEVQVDQEELKSKSENLIISIAQIMARIYQR